MPSCARRLGHVRLDRPDLLRVAEAAERGRGHGVGEHAPGEDPDVRHSGTGRSTVYLPLRDDPVGDVGVRADQVVRVDVAEDDRAVAPEAGPDVDLRRSSGEPPGTSPRGVRTSRTGRPVSSAMNASSGSYLACCLPPNAPPGSGAKTRTFESGRPSSVGDHALQPVRVLDRAPDRDPVAVGRGHERVRLDRELGDHREAVRALDDDLRVGGRRVDVAPAVAVLAQDVRARRSGSFGRSDGSWTSGASGRERLADRVDAPAAPRTRP